MGHPAGAELTVRAAGAARRAVRAAGGHARGGAAVEAVLRLGGVQENLERGDGVQLGRLLVNFACGGFRRTVLKLEERKSQSVTSNLGEPML